MRFRMFSVLLLIAAFTTACGVPATATPPPSAGSTPTPTSAPTPSPTIGAHPAWLAQLIATFTAGEVADPPITISEYVYNGAAVYFVPQRCCDIFSDLYDDSGVLIAHPDGGIAGTGDGRASDFSTSARFVRVVWEDPRGQRELVQAPIESVEVVVLESYPPQYRALVTSGLPNGCARFHHWTVHLDEAARLFTIEVLNSAPKPGADTLCAMVYGTLDHSIPLEGVESGQTYKVEVNGQATTFTAQ